MKIIILFFLLISVAFSQEYDKDFPVLKGYYLGQDPPGNSPVLFAPEILKAEAGFHSSIIFSPDLTEAYWSPMEIKKSVLWHSRMENGTWSKPEIVNLRLDNGTTDFTLSPDGKKLYFLSFHMRPHENKEQERIWFVEKNREGWSEPRLIDEVIYNHPTHWTFSVSAKGNLYFTSEKASAKGIYVSKFVKNKFGEPQKLFEGSMPFIAPDESYLVYILNNVNSKTDLYIRFKNSDDTWSEAISLGPEVNSDSHDLAPYVSPDGKYLFFTSQREKMNAIMWVSTEIIETLKQEWLWRLK